MRDLLLLDQPNTTAEHRARALGMQLRAPDGGEWGEWDRALIVGEGATIPWDLVPAGLHFVERWDAACPLWRYGVLAEDLGTPEDRARTRALTRDLRIPVYAPELLFLRASAAGRALYETWQAECAQSDARLAFLRALYLVKPTFCALPTLWLREAMVGSPRHNPPAQSGTGGMIAVEIAPGQYVRCFASEADKITRRYQQQRMTREERRRHADHD